MSRQGMSLSTGGSTTPRPQGHHGIERTLTSDLCIKNKNKNYIVVQMLFHTTAEIVKSFCTSGFTINLLSRLKSKRQLVYIGLAEFGSLCCLKLLEVIIVLLNMNVRVVICN